MESPEPVLRSPCSAGQSFRCCPSSGSRRTFRGRRRAATPGVPSEVRSRQRLDVSHPLARRGPCVTRQLGTSRWARTGESRPCWENRSFPVRKAVSSVSIDI